MKRALRSMLMSRRPSARSLVGLTRRRALRGGRESSSEETEEDAREFDMGLWKELNDELLREAAGVALPGERVEVNGDGGAVEEEEDEDEDEGEGEEVGVRGGGGVEGVAVTEEAVETGVVDVVLGG